VTDVRSPEEVLGAHPEWANSEWHPTWDEGKKIMIPPKRLHTLPEGTRPEDVLDLTGGYTPLPAQRRFHSSLAKFRLYGGGFGSGKSKCGVREAIYKAIQHPGSAGGIFRLRLKDLTLTTGKTFWEELTAMGINRKPFIKKWSASLQELTLWNGSTILFSGLDDEMKLRSMSLSWAFVDEGSEVPEHIYRTLLGRIRWKGPLRLWVTTNPGPSAWLRKNFVDATKPNYDRFDAPTKENTHLDPGYIQSLYDEYPEVWVRIYLEGSWEAFEGQVFMGFTQETHVPDLGFWTPPDDWLVYEGYDFGFRNPTHVTWTAWDPSGENPLVTFAEHSAKEWTVDEHVDVIRAKRAEYGVHEDQIICVGDPAGAQVQGLVGLSYYDEYGNHGIGISAGTKEPSIRAVRLSKLFKKTMKTRAWGTTPMLLFARGHTQNTVRSVINYRYAINRSTTQEDPKEQFHKEDDHGVDSEGYGVMAIPVFANEPEPRKGFPMAAAKPFSSRHDEDFEDDDEPPTVYGIQI
jgi:phage terminase large subunit